MDIDFVILWVDGTDPEWLKERKRYSTHIKCRETDDANGECRYRGNDDLLRFWFRGVEKNAQWVHKIFFVSCGQVPAWLETSHPTLEIVNHKDFIPKEYLPTFNCRSIQFNLHRIRNLAEHFVLFEDDVFLLNTVRPEAFFREENPVLQTYLGYINKGNDNWNRVLWNDYGIVNSHFNIGKAIWKNRHKWFSIKQLGLSYAAYNYFCYRINKTLPVYNISHLAHPHLKSTINEIWKAIPDEANSTSMNKFRSDDQLNHFLFAAWNQASGRFFPISINTSIGKFFTITPKTLLDICKSIDKKEYPVICVNDSSMNTEFEHAWKGITESFARIYPNKSAFEK